MGSAPAFEPVTRIGSCKSRQKEARRREQKDKLSGTLTPLANPNSPLTPPHQG